MPRNEYKWVSLSDFSGGIDQHPEEAQENQVMDARNMWAPHKKIQQRPGFKSVADLNTTNTVGAYSTSAWKSNNALLDSSGTVYTTLAAYIAAQVPYVMDYYYVDRAYSTRGPIYYFALGHPTDATYNTNAAMCSTYAFSSFYDCGKNISWEYYSSGGWRPLTMKYHCSIGGPQIDNFLQPDSVTDSANNWNFFMSWDANSINPVFGYQNTPPATVIPVTRNANEYMYKRTVAQINSVETTNGTLSSAIIPTIFPGFEGATETSRYWIRGIVNGGDTQFIPFHSRESGTTSTGDAIHADSVPVIDYYYTSSLSITDSVVAYAGKPVYGNGVWVTTGTSGSNGRIQTSTDNGLTWSTTLTGAGTYPIYDIVYGNSMFVAVGAVDTVNGYTYTVTSTDGINWTQRANIAWVECYGITYGDGYFYACGMAGGAPNNGTIIRWDGVLANAWARVPTPLDKDLYSIAFDGTKFIASGAATGAPANCAYTVTGTVSGGSWTQVTGVGTDEPIYIVKYGNGLWVLGGHPMGATATVVTSATGASGSWTVRSVTDESLNIGALAYGNGMWIVVGPAKSTGKALVSISSDGLTWTDIPSSLTGDINNCTYANSKFMIRWVTGGVYSFATLSYTPSITLGWLNTIQRYSALYSTTETPLDLVFWDTERSFAIPKLSRSTVFGKSSDNLAVIVSNSLSGKGSSKRGFVNNGIGLPNDLMASSTVISAVSPDTTGFLYVTTPYATVKFDSRNGWEAKVSSDQDAVGTLDNGDPAPYNSETLALLDFWPNAKFITTYQERLFVAGDVVTSSDKDPYGIRWSAPIPYQDVWPKHSYARINDLDSSPITGLKAFGEQLAVFRQDSIWRALNLGVDSFGIGSYQFVKVPGTIGTVAPRSIVDINNQLFFLSEDGVYVYDGVNQPKKISDQLHDFFTKLPKKKMQNASAVHWKANHCYLLSVCSNDDTATAQQTNNVVLCYDYVLNAWWIWNNINAQFWCKVEGLDDEEIIYFVDEQGSVHQLNDSQNTDNGEQINSWFACHRMIPANFNTMTLREVQVYGEMEEISNLYVDVYSDDDYGNLTTGHIDFNDSNIPKVGTAIVGSDMVIKQAPRQVKKIMFRKTGKMINIGVGTDESSDNIGKPWAISKISCGFIPWGKR